MKIKIYSCRIYKDANLRGIILGGIIFSIGMVMYGYCPGTALVASATGSVHALIGVFGMIAGAILFALSFDWLQHHILNIWSYGGARLPALTGIPDSIWLSGLLVFTGVILLVKNKISQQV